MPEMDYRLIDLMVNPGRAFHRFKLAPLPWKLPTVLYALSLMAAAFFYAYKPAGFPEGSMTADVEAKPVYFWLLAGSFGAVLTVGVNAVSWLILRYTGKTQATMAQLLMVVFSSHFYYLLLFIVLSLASWQRWVTLYKTGEMFFSLASLIFTIRGIRAVAHVSIPKAFLALFLSSLAAIAVLLALSLTGLIPSEFFRALLLI